jgi:hypothetical protein
MTGACICGIASTARSGTSTEIKRSNPDESLTHDWIASLLQSINKEHDDSVCRRIIKDALLATISTCKWMNSFNPT